MKKGSKMMMMNTAFGQQVKDGDLMYVVDHNNAYVGLVYGTMLYGVDASADASDVDAYKFVDLDYYHGLVHACHLPVATDRERTVCANAKAYIDTHGWVVSSSLVEDNNYVYVDPEPGHVYAYAWYDALQSRCDVKLYLGRGLFVSFAGDSALVTDNGHVYVDVKLGGDRMPITVDDVRRAVRVAQDENGVAVDACNVNAVSVNTGTLTASKVDLGKFVAVDANTQIMVNGEAVGMFRPA